MNVINMEYKVIELKKIDLDCRDEVHLKLEVIQM